MFYQAFNKIVKQSPHQTAVVSAGNKVSYLELDNAVQNFVSVLQQNNVRQGSAVLIILPNSLEFVVAVFAVMALRAIAVPVNTKFPADEIKYYFDSSHAGAVIHAGLSDAVSDVVASGNKIAINFADLTAAPGHNSTAGIVEHTISSSDAAIYMYSSGSTGKPKRVTRTHGQLIAEAVALTATLDLTADDNILCTVPLYHAHGFGNCLMASLLNGGTLVLTPGEFNSREVTRLLERCEITIYPAVPFMFKMLGETFYKVKPILPKLRLLVSAGAALQAEIYESFEKVFNKQIMQLYGSTETGAVAVNYLPERDTSASVGRPLHGFEVDILDESGTPVADGSIGEIAIRAPSMTHQYDGLPEITAECFVNNYFLPGDLGMKDVNGAIYIKGRKKLLINVAGNKVDPLDVEAVISKHPKVQDVVVLGQPDALYGEMVKAVVVSRGECSVDEITSFCAAHLIEYKVPKLVVFRSEIPRSPLGKILRKYLQE